MEFLTYDPTRTDALRYHTYVAFQIRVITRHAKLTESPQVLRLRRDDAFGVHAQAGAAAAVRAARRPLAELRVQEIVRKERKDPLKRLMEC